MTVTLKTSTVASKDFWDRNGPSHDDFYWFTILVNISNQSFTKPSKRRAETSIASLVTFQFYFIPRILRFIILTFYLFHIIPYMPHGISYYQHYWISKRIQCSNFLRIYVFQKFKFTTSIFFLLFQAVWFLVWRLSKGELSWNYKMASTSVRDLDCRADPADAREPLYFLNMEAVPPPSPPKKPRLHTI